MSTNIILKKQELQLSEVSELKVVDEARANQIKMAFVPMVNDLASYQDEYFELIEINEDDFTIETTEKAKALRLNIVKVRTETEKIRKSQKEDFLRAGKAIDGVGKFIKQAASNQEERLKSIEDYLLNKKKAAQEALQSERALLLKPYITEEMPLDLYAMEADVWDAFLIVKKRQYDERIATEKRELKERLDKEAEEKAAFEKLRLDNEVLRQLSLDSKELAEKERIENERKVKLERDRREFAELKLQAKEEAEEKARKLKLERTHTEYAESDPEKFACLAKDIENLVSKYESKFKSEKSKQKMTRIVGVFNAVVNELMNDR